jgi:hypothetical protein
MVKPRTDTRLCANDRKWREAAVPNIGRVPCGMCYEIEMI